MKLTFWGAAGTVTGSCHLLEIGKTKILIDCGMFQGAKDLRERNYQPFGFNPGEIDYVLLTHAHIDHSGMIPKLVKNGFRGFVYATGGTVDLCKVMLPDSGYIQEMDVERINRKNIRAGKPQINPVYTMQDAEECLRYFKKIKYEEIFILSPNIRVCFLDAGHILGSAMIEIFVLENGEERKLLFTGDLGRDNKAYLNDPEDVVRADYLIMESTYGNRFHQDSENRLEALEKIAWDTYRKGGNLVIPAFAVERTQDLLYDINLLQIENRFPPMEIYIDSPMAIAATEVFKSNQQFFDEETKCLIKANKSPLQIPNLKYSQTTEESVALNQKKGGAVIISASGMCDAGRIKHHLKHNLWRPESTILFVGFQAEGSKGRSLLNGLKTIKIHGEEIVVKADICQIDAYSSHADQGELLKWLSNFTSKPRKVFLVHGDPEATQTLKKLIKDKFDFDVFIPNWQDEVELFFEKEVTNEDVRGAYKLVHEKLQEFLTCEENGSDCEAIMLQLSKLQKLLDDVKR